ncbi:MAG: hypothetical protein AAGA55_07790, partial [Planctomycetota bacterium]
FGVPPGESRIQFAHHRSEGMVNSGSSTAFLQWDKPANGAGGTGFADGHAKTLKIDDYPTTYSANHESWMIE